MRFRAFALALVTLLVLVSVALAGFCPRCHKQIPENKKYCDDCAAYMQTVQTQSLSEKEFVDALLKRRDEYEKALGELRRFYQNRGERESVEKVEMEINDLVVSRKYVYQNWEDPLPALTPTENIREAELLYKEAESLRPGIFTLKKDRRLLEAADTYRRLIQKYPTSVRVADAAYRLGEIYEELGGPDTRRAARFYVLCFMWEPGTVHPARYKAAAVYDVKLRDYRTAAWLYKLAIEESADKETRDKAAIRFAQLQKEGYTGEPPQLKPTRVEGPVAPPAGPVNEKIGPPTK